MTEPTSKPRGFGTIVAPMLQSRKLAAVLAVIAAAQLGTTYLGLAWFPCPFLRNTGLPCPGCGLTRGCVALLRGDWHGALRWHAFAPLALACIFLIALAAALPARLVQPMVRAVNHIERTTGITRAILVLLVFYWIARICYHPLSLPR